MVLAARERAALYVNQELTLLYWDIGKRIHKDVLGFERANYGQAIMENLGERLTLEFGRGYGWRNLFNMVQFATEFPDRQILQTLSAKLTWSHLLELLRIDDPRAREFYGELTRLHHWGVRALRERIRSRLYERTLLSRKPDELIAQELTLLREEDKLTVDMVLRDPYLLSGLGLGDNFSERELEHKGQMEYYLNWLSQNEREEGEEPPIGIILCSEAHPDDVSLMGLDSGDIRVARYITQTLPPPLLEKKLKEIVARQKEFQARKEQQQNKPEQ
jgi:hypothetical protein